MPNVTKLGIQEVLADHQYLGVFRYFRRLHISFVVTQGDQRGSKETGNIRDPILIHGNVSFEPRVVLRAVATVGHIEEKRERLFLYKLFANHRNEDWWPFGFLPKKRLVCHLKGQQETSVDHIQWGWRNQPHIFTFLGPGWLQYWRSDSCNGQNMAMDILLPNTFDLCTKYPVLLLLLFLVLLKLLQILPVSYSLHQRNMWFGSTRSEKNTKPLGPIKISFSISVSEKK